MSTSHNFKDRVVIVTGSSDGIGAVIALHFASLNANVVVSGRKQEKIDAILEKCRALTKAELLGVTADISTDDGAKKLINETVKKFGKIHVLVNNAGIGGLVRLENPKVMEVYDKIFATNVRAPIHLSHLALPHLKKTRGNIVNISSVAGLRPYTYGVAYCSSKAALDMVTKVLTIELGQTGVRVNSVNPAVVKSSLFEAQGRSPQEVKEIYGLIDRSYPLGRTGEPEDIAKAVAFLASDESLWTSGLLMNVDGGSQDCNTTHTPQEFLEILVKNTD